MPETSEKILTLLGEVMPQMSESEKDRVLWFAEGMAAAARATQDSA